MNPQMSTPEQVVQSVPTPEPSEEHLDATFEADLAQLMTLHKQNSEVLKEYHQTGQEELMDGQLALSSQIEELKKRIGKYPLPYLFQQLELKRGEKVRGYREVSNASGDNTLEGREKRNSLAENLEDVEKQLSVIWLAVMDHPSRKINVVSREIVTSPEFRMRIIPRIQEKEQQILQTQDLLERELLKVELQALYGQILSEQIPDYKTN
jgi:hypothetical protein